MEKYNYFLSSFIANVRNFKNLTQKKFGEKIDKSEIAIRKYESGQIKIPFSVLFLVIKIFELNIFEVKRLLDYVLFQNIIFSTENNNKIKFSQSDIKECYDLFASDLTKIYNTNIESKNLENIYYKTDLINIFKTNLYQYASALLSVKNLIINDFSDDEINDLLDSTLNVFNKKIEILIKKRNEKIHSAD
ncbi:hypothetical protein HMPREF2931_06195 [Fusobacterium sp. HMSC065F01]|uniref:helix-turn-helix domain-containing protein n=1 Tax=Fusobacterium sp. HMSC065F01 TaxID=1739435 RepID=UPI0008A30A94|nr:helix-turn-helix transcriptional regulator [Fusobacterium sp. HMSC065F01]OFQ56980.1 hypothetical protein HMPREF2931_06195 [Fusobacterium sp. HMSC065F01]